MSWSGDPVAWSTLPHTRRLKVQFSVQFQVAGFDPRWGRIWEATNGYLSLSFSFSLSLKSHVLRWGLQQTTLPHEEKREGMEGTEKYAFHLSFMHGDKMWGGWKRIEGRGVQRIKQEHEHRNLTRWLILGGNVSSGVQKALENRDWNCLLVVLQDKLVFSPPKPQENLTQSASMSTDSLHI